MNRIRPKAALLAACLLVSAGTWGADRKEALPDEEQAIAMLQRVIEGHFAGRLDPSIFAPHLADDLSAEAPPGIGPMVSVLGASQEPNGYYFDVKHENVDVRWGLYFSDTKPPKIVNFSWAPIPPFPGDVPLATPEAWAGLAHFANRSVLVRNGEFLHFRVAPDGNAMYSMTLGTSGEAVPHSIYRLAGDGVVIRRAYHHAQMSRETFFRGEALDHQTIRWSRTNSSPEFYTDWTIERSPHPDHLGGVYTVTPNEMSESLRPFRSLFVSMFFGSRVDSATAKMQQQDVGIVQRAHAQWQNYLANNSGATTTNAWASALYSGLSAGAELARQQEFQSRQSLDATLAALNARAAAQAQAGHRPPQQTTAVSPLGQQVEAAAAPSRADTSTPYRSLEGAGTGSWEAAGGSASTSSAGQASTRDDANGCVSAPVTSTHRCDTLSGYKGRVANSCSVPVDVRMCFMTASGWNCQSRYGLGPQQSWEPGWCHANTGQVFHSVRYSDSSEPLASP